MEIFLKLTDEQGNPTVKIRASGPESEMGELIDWFERVTGLAVNIPETKWRRLHRGPRPTVGQQSMFDTAPVEMTQLSSQDATVPDDGLLS